MSTKIFVNLPVSDLPRSRRFFEALGYTFNDQFCDDTAACVVISEHIHTMLLTHAKFREFAPGVVCDTTRANEVLLCLSCATRAEVDALVRKAVAAGGSAFAPPKDYGFMYQHGFQDPDGHIWELIHLDEAALARE